MDFTDKQKEAMRIKCAELRGWTDIKNDWYLEPDSTQPQLNGIPPGNDPQWPMPLPNYPEDINTVMAEVRKLCSDPQQVTEYEDTLYRVIGNVGWSFLATAAEHTLALILTHEPDWKLPE
jgi:hypothetical protein